MGHPMSPQGFMPGTPSSQAMTSPYNRGMSCLESDIEDEYHFCDYCINSNIEKSNVSPGFYAKDPNSKAFAISYNRGKSCLECDIEDEYH